ncbi:MAG: hypothetical protein K2P87_01545 [Lachnospiraceae bacterium]|nr:hypothetical protein [Lachnospiraceae bacterium]
MRRTDFGKLNRREAGGREPDAQNIGAESTETAQAVQAAVFLKKLGGIDASIVEEAAQEGEIIKFRKHRRVKFAAAAALIVICLTAGGGIVAASMLGIKIFDMRSSADDSSYAVGFAPRCRPQNAFGGHIEEVKATIRKQCEEYKPWMSKIPTHWNSKFEDWESAFAFLEIDFMEVPVTSIMPSWVDLIVEGSKEGPLESVMLNATYMMDKYNISIWANIYVDDSEEQIEAQMYSATGGEANYRSEPYITANKIPCTLVDTLVLETDGCTHAEGYIVKDGILYRVSAVPQQRKGEMGENRMDIVKELLEEIASR